MTDTNDLFQSADPAQTTSKYDSWDLDALKKKADMADAHISTLERENASYRENTTTTTTLEEILEKLDQTRTNPLSFTPSMVETKSTAERPSSSPSKEELASIVEAIIENKQKKTLAQQNVEQVRQSLEKTWGNDYKLRLAERSKQLNMSQDFLASMAESYPSVFLKLITEDQKTNPNAHLPPNTQSRPTLTLDQPMNTWAQFSKAMKDNPRLRQDSSFQRRMHDTAEKLGDNFFN